MRKTFIGIGLMVWSAFLLAGCGSGDNVARGTINGQLIEIGVDEVFCDAGALGLGPETGGAISGSPMQCKIYYNTGRLSDRLEIYVADAETIYYDFIDTWRPFDGTLIRGNLVIQGIPQPILDGNSFIKFESISTAPGYPVCAQYDILTAIGQYEGRFCTNVGSGYPL